MDRSDAGLLGLLREGAEGSFSALHELERRHFAAVRAFAESGVVHPPAAEELAQLSWDAALRQQTDGGDEGGAVRPCALTWVLRTASEWAQGHRRDVLDPQLAAWTDTAGPLTPESTATGIRPSSLAARAFTGLPRRSQALLWHGTVEGDDTALTARLTGADPHEVPALSERARTQLHNAYVRALRDASQDECRPYHRLVLAYADTRSAGIAAEVAPHLERCARCSGAVADLGHLRHGCGMLLARTLLPWGGAEYAARGVGGGVRPEPTPEEDFTSAAAAGGPSYGGLPYGHLSYGGPAVGDRRSPGRTPGVRPVGRGRHAGLAAAGADGRTRSGRRTGLIVRCAAAAGVCAVGAAFAIGFAGDSATEGRQSRKPPQVPVPASELPSPSASPSPSRTTAIAKSTSRAAPEPTTTKPATPAPGTSRPSPSPSADDPVVQWLFGEVDEDSVTPDSSDNGKDGSLFGASRPRPADGELTLDGRQFVASDGPLVDTGRSFSVSARVELDRTDVSQTVVSQDSSEASAFLLRYDADESRWEMRMPRQDTDDANTGAADEAASKSPPQAGEPARLTGVYDDGDDELRLYVDGRLAGTTDREDDFASAGRFIVGRGLSGNEFFQGVDGTVDDVQAFRRALSSAEVRSLSRKS